MATDTNPSHTVQQDGITVEKTPAVVSDFYLDHAVELMITNETADRRIVGIHESLPRGCHAADTVVRWDGLSESRISPRASDGDVQIRLNMNPHETVHVTYWPRPDDDSAYQRLLGSAPRVAVRSQRNNRTDTSASVEHDSTTTANQPAADGESTGQAGRQHPGVLEEPTDGVQPPPGIDFGDVAGFTDIKRELKAEIIDPFLDQRFDEYNIGKANGVFLYGPPGTGKTHLATALAGELGYNYFPLKSSQLRDSKIGQTQENIAQAFDTATTYQPCVVLLDELDSIAPERDGALHQARVEAVNELLQHVGELNDQNTDVVVVGATNRPDLVDDALKRTGRFDTRIKVGLPDESTRVAILEHELRQFDGHVEPVWMDAAVLDAFVAATTNFTASDIVEVVDAAKRASLRRTDPEAPPRITEELLLEQVDTVDEKQEADAAGEFLTETPEIEFSDVGGMDETKARLRKTLLEPLSNPELYDEYGLTVANGVLLYGPPGTGKTYLSRALAGEADCSFLPITASDIVSKWIGEAAQNIRELFEKARAVAPAIIFIDEIDALASSRGGATMANSEQQAVNELLAQLSALDNENVFVVGTTNRLDIVDEAITRAGRLGETIEVPPPDTDARIAILQQQLRGRPLKAETIDWAELGDLTETDAGTPPYVAADLEKIADEAARAAMQEADAAVVPITHEHLTEAIETVPPSLDNSSKTS